MIKVTARLLQVSVVVYDKKGAPVADLTKDDFVLFDKGQQQQIRYFARESSDPPQDVPAQAEGVVSNRFVTFKVDGKVKVQPLPESLTVILLDGLNTRFVDQAQAREAVVKFLKQLHPGDQVAIYTLTDTLRVLHDFTSDISSLLAALDRHRNQSSPAEAASSFKDSHIGGVEAPVLDALIDRGNAMVAGYSKVLRAQTTLQAIQAIANHLAGLPGRKNLIWLSGGFPVPVGAINDVGMAIYPVDARGLIGMADWMPSLNAATPSPPSMPSILLAGPKPMDERTASDVDTSRATMNMLAESTGGRAFLNNNDIAGGIRRAMDDARVTYALYYSPSHDQWDGKFREIKVKVDRPGLEARYRKGYYAIPDLPKDEDTRQTVLASAASSPLPSTGLSLVAKLLEKPTEASPHAALSVVMDGREISFTPNGQGQNDANVDLLLLVFGDQPAPLNQEKRVVHLSLKLEEYETLVKGGVRVKLVVAAPVKSQRVRVVARDPASGRVGSLDVPLN